MVFSKREIGKKVKEARFKKSKQLGHKYTQQMLADELGISRGYLGDIEAGRTYPNYVLLSRIANICGVPLNFFGEESSDVDVTNQMQPEFGTYVNTLKEEPAEILVLDSKEADLILRFRKLPSASQQTVLALIDNLEIIEKTKNEQTAMESEVG